MNIGDWSGITPEAIRGFSEADLLEIMRLNAGGVYDRWASNELNRRHEIELRELITSLRSATENVHKEVADLASSSVKLEKMTSRLITFTIWLLVFAFIQIVVAGVQTWKMFRPDAERHNVPVSTLQE